MESQSLEYIIQGGKEAAYQIAKRMHVMARSLGQVPEATTDFVRRVFAPLAEHLKEAASKACVEAEAEASAGMAEPVKDVRSAAPVDVRMP